MRSAQGETRYAYEFLLVLGGVAQLGERLNGIQEVRGSIPLTSIPAPALIRLAESLWGEL